MMVKTQEFVCKVSGKLHLNSCQLSREIFSGCSLIALNWVQDILFAHDIGKIWGKLKCLTRNILSQLEIFWNSFQFTDSSCVWTKPFRIVLHHFCVLCVAFCITRTRPKGNFLQIEIRKGLNHHLPSNSWLKSTSINLRAEGHPWDAIASENVKYYELLRISTQFLEQKESERNRLGEYWAQLHETLLLGRRLF